MKGKDGRLFGPLPKDWVTFKGIFLGKDGTAIQYRVGETSITETFISTADKGAFYRLIQVGAGKSKLKMRVGKATEKLPNKNYVIEDESLC